MAESRAAPRTNVSWRAAIALLSGKIVPAKVVNFSGGALKLQCAHHLRDGEIYQMMMQVPSHSDASIRTEVICKVKCIYSTLSGNEYHAGMKYFEVPDQHTDLLHFWSGLSITARAQESIATPINELANMV